MTVTPKAGVGGSPTQRYKKIKRLGVSMYVKDPKGDYVKNGGNYDLAGTVNIRIPGVPHAFKNRDALIKFLKNSPGYVEKQRGWLNTHRRDAMHAAGFQVQKGKLTKYVQPKDRPIIDPKGKAAPDKAAWAASAAPVAEDTGTGGFEIPTVDFSAIDKLNPKTGVIIDRREASKGAKLFGPGAAEAQAGLQFDSKILNLRDQALRNPLDTAQHTKDIGSWYGQVLSSLKTAGERDSALQKAAVDETVANTGVIAGAIGGAANEGSALVGAAGAEAAGTLGALGLAQDQYNADLAPILEAEAAGQKTREAAAGSSKLADLKLQIAAALGERGQAEVANQFGVDQANNQILDNRAAQTMQIIQANNATRQTNFQNQYGVETTKLGAQVSGAQVAGDLAETAIREVGDAASAAAKKGPKPWASTPASQKTYAYKNFTGELAGNLKAYQANPKLLLNYTRNFVNRNGWSMQNPNVMSWIRNAYREAGIQG